VDRWLTSRAWASGVAVRELPRAIKDGVKEDDSSLRAGVVGQ
jgi:hypothetical protein